MTHPCCIVRGEQEEKSLRLSRALNQERLSQIAGLPANFGEGEGGGGICTVKPDPKWLWGVQTEKSLRKEDSDKVQSLEAALQEAHAELKAEKLLLQQVCFSSALANIQVICCIHKECSQEG